MAETAQGPSKIVVKLYQFFHISTAFLYCALLIRWMVLIPLTSTRFLPGGIHEFLCYLMIYSSIGSILWWVKFQGLNKRLLNRHNLKNINLIYFVAVMHFYDDYEHSPVLKNSSYSTFIVGLSLTQMYHHWCKIFKTKKTNTNSRSMIQRINLYVAIPLLYISEFYLLLLNTEIDNYHNGPNVVLLNKAVLVTFIPLCMHLYRGLLF